MPQPLQTGPRPSRVSTPRRSGGLLMHPSQVWEWRPPASAPACVVIPLCFFRAAPPALPPSFSASAAFASAAAHASLFDAAPVHPSSTHPPPPAPNSPLSQRPLRTQRENVDNHPFPWKNNRHFFCHHSFLPYFCTPKNTIALVFRVRFRSSVGRAIHF